MSKPPRVISVSTVPPAVLRIEWSTGETMETDIGDWIGRFAILAPLKNKKLFSTAKVGYAGHGVEWTEDIDLGADQLYERCKEQVGELMPVEEFRAWMKRNGLSLSMAAMALGLSRRMVAYYHSGTKPIPKIVRLACAGYDHAREKRAA
ncbi:MAG: DUF2442 domain-containing protein [Gammaproteobacteria bacterium]